MERPDLSFETFAAFLSLAIYFLWLLMLTFYGNSGTLQTVQIFAIGIAFGAIVIGFAYLTDYDPGFEILGTFELKEFLVALMAFGGLLGIMLYIAPNIGGTPGIVFGLALGAVVLFAVYLITENIFVPIGVHAAYNSSLYFFASLSLIPTSTLATSPIHIPVFTFTGTGVPDLLIQIFLQVFAVATAEELMKISGAIGFSIFLNTTNKYITMGLSGAGWVILHTVLAYR